MHYTYRILKSQKGSGRKTKGLLAFFVPFLLLFHKIFHYLMSSESAHIIYALLTATQCVQTLKVAKSCVLAPIILIKETWRVPFALYKEGHDVFNHHSLTRCVKKEKCQLLKLKTE